MSWSKDDPLVEESLYHELSQTLTGGPRLIFKDGGHFIQETHADELGAAVLDFLALEEMRRMAGRG
eukprot:763544-Hanusia_phi.AAC.1